MYLSLEVDRRGPVAEITLRGPGKGNALGPDVWRELPAVVEVLDADPEVRVLLLKGSGDHFTYGLDLKGMMPDLGPHLAGTQLAGQRLVLLELIERLQRAVDALERCRKPVVAAIWGWCIGGGVDLVSAVDIRVCSEDAMFSVREIQLAMVADLGTLQRLPRIVGQGHARHLALTGEDFDAAHAARIGLVTQVYPDREATLEGARAVAERVASLSVVATQGVKRILNWSADHSSRDGLAYVAAWNAAFLQSEDLGEAIAAFSARRSPRFTGR